MLILLILLACTLPGLAILAASEQTRKLAAFGLVLDFVGGLLIASDGLPSAHDFFSRAPLMPWRAIDSALAKLDLATDGNTPALTPLDDGFDELVSALRRFNREIPPTPGKTWTFLDDSTVGFYRIPIFSGSVTVAGVNHTIEPLAGIVVARSRGAPIVVGSEAGLRGLIDRYRLSWFVVRGMIPIVLGFAWQLLALLIEGVSPTSEKPSNSQKPATEQSEDAG